MKSKKKNEKNQDLKIAILKGEIENNVVIGNFY
jgi:hypothetical protein